MHSKAIVELTVVYDNPYSHYHQFFTNYIIPKGVQKLIAWNISTTFNNRMQYYVVFNKILTLTLFMEIKTLFEIV